MSISRLSKSACNSSNVITQSIYDETLSFFASAFFAVHGPMKTIFASGSRALIHLPRVAIGERQWDRCCVSFGKFCST